MPLLGKLIKKSIDVANDLFEEDKNPVEAQTEVLKNLLESAKNTDFGKRYQFNEILKSEDLAKSFRVSVPCFDYHRMFGEWWNKTVEGIPDVTWPGSPEYFALSSGTTGSKSKRIPVTKEMIEAIRSTGIKQVMSLSDYDLPDEFFQKGILMLGSSTELEERDGHLEGEISGISASNIPFWFKGYYKPGEEIAKIQDWDERVQRIAEQAPNWDIGALSGIPSWIELMLKKVIEHNNLKNIHEIWPSLSVFTTGGVPFEPHQESFEKLLDHPLLYLDTYLASEGFIALQVRPNEDMSMQLAYDGGIYFEFIPFQPEYFDENGAPYEDAPALSLAQVEEGNEYAMLISTVSGAWRYSIGDTIKFTNKERAEIKITGRTKFFLNVVGSQLSVNKMTDAIQKLEEEYKISISEFTVAAVKHEGEFYHQWIIGSENENNIDEESLANSLDKALKSANKNYGVARSKALKGVKLKLVNPEIFYDWAEQTKKKGGQIKIPQMMSESEMKAFLEFIS
ncbi:GH3 auxin-responsive promoter [Roseivirga seohaensis]|uniref:GH3 auxin-responsive promoter n=1 Tax=Roseivirga seohaensis TaxID=1914963 RepID=A0A150Y0Q0_9BACT|nr:GH3 auxin-responsive promoter family protein [Roseivirga seohaensis]KYG84610.1 GH3 auxin-responsive promoter [Roseivirga seohaensis]